LAVHGKQTQIQKISYSAEDGNVPMWSVKGGFELKKPNEKLMLTFGLSIVVAWVLIAATASYFSIVAERDITDSQLTVIGLLGGPALLIITSVLDLFKSKEGQKISILPERIMQDREATEAVANHSRTLESLRIKHELQMELMTKEHDLSMEAFRITKGESE
tara:strand:- start:1267 stop:1752 length:486 start_codon:yes stop_codon:yes gene_type:complete